jgi:hypothetical protein
MKIDIKNKFLKHTSGIFYLIWLIYFVLCICLTFERMLNTDCSYQLFNIINNKTFFFQENRFGVLFTQLPLLAGIYLHAPMKLLVYLYSLGFPLYYLLIIWINHRVLKCYEAALASIMALIIGAAATFFHSITETHQLLTLSALLYGVFCSREKFKKTWHYYLLILIVLLWNHLTHPNAVFTIFFVTGLAFLQRKIKLKEALTVILFMGIFIGVKIVLTPKNTYDARQYDQLLNFKEALPQFFTLYPYRFLWTKIPNLYLSAFGIFCLVWIFYRKFKELVFTTMCFLGFSVISILTFYKGDCDAMMEKSFLPGTFMFVLLYSIYYYKIQRKTLIFFVTLLLCLSSFINIVKVSEQYTIRLNFLSGILDKMDNQNPKLIANFSDLDEGPARLNSWATSMDAMILSRCENDSARTIFLVENKYKCIPDLKDSSLFLYMGWDPYSVKLLNKYYFNLPQVPYKIYENYRIINLKASNGKFVCADHARKDIVVANRDAAWDWETFWLLDLGNGKFAIRTSGYKFVCSELNSQNKEITASRNDIEDWEMFSMIHFADKIIGFKAANGKFICVDENTKQLLANCDSVENAGRFEIIDK